MTAAAVAIQSGSEPLANARHERFCQEYMVDRNGQAAYQRAGYSTKGDAAKVSASRLLTAANVAARVAYLESLRIERIGMAADDVLRELAVIGLSDVRHYQFTDDALGIKLTEDAPDIAMRAVASVRRKRRIIQRDGAPDEVVEEVEYKLWPKTAALRMAGEHLKLFTQKVEVTGQPIGPPMSEEELVRGVTEMLRRVKSVHGKEKLLKAAGVKDADYEVLP